MRQIIFTNIKFAFVIAALSSSSFSATIADKYPSYQYIFNEFNIDDSYVDNSDFVHFVKKNEKRMRRFYKNSLKRGNEVLPTIQGLLIDDGVSDLFIYLSMVESGFSNKAISPKKAVGLWQFMPATARRFNLEVCKANDERCDTARSTSAAIKYLNVLHKDFGKWYLAAMAYNCGEGCVKKAISRAGSNDLSVLTSNQSKYLPRETRDYIRKILLVAMIGEEGSHDVYEPKGEFHTPDSYIEVEIANSTSIKSLAKLLKMKTKALERINKEKKPIKNKSNYYKVTIPLEKIYAFYLRYNMPARVSKEKSRLVSHYVAIGETLESIAKKYDSDTREIKATNHLDSDYLTLGQFLAIPVSQVVFKRESKKSN